MERIPYFAYGTTQAGFAHHRRLADLLGEPVARVRTVAAHAVVVPRQAACSNPGCQLVHRMAALVPGREPLRVDGDLFLVSDDAIAILDQPETGGPGSSGPYVPDVVAVASENGPTTTAAHAYLAREPARWHALVELGEADALSTYSRDLASGERLKPCCVRAPGHPPPHDVLDPLTGVEQREGG
jgi:Gamma-glutamyl cyclotransferase, AIG2-like